MPHSVRRCAILLSLAGSLAACSGDEADRPEVTVGYGVRLDEGELTAAVSGRRIDVRLRLERTVDAALDGQLTLKLRRVGETDALQKTTRPFRLDKRFTDIELELARPSGVKTIPQLGGYVLTYLVKLPDGELFGHRSLYTAAAHATLTVVGNNRFAVGEKSALRVRIADPATGRGVAGKSVQLYFTPKGKSARRLASGTTDEGGSWLPHFSFAANDVGTGALSVRDGSRQTSHEIIVERSH